MGATPTGSMSGFAVQMPDDPGLAGLTALPKVVFPRLGGTLSWANSELVAGTPSQRSRVKATDSGR